MNITLHCMHIINVCLKYLTVFVQSEVLITSYNLVLYILINLIETNKTFVNASISPIIYEFC